MAISTETRRSDRYACDGVQTAFPFAFKVFAAGEIGVVVSIDGGEESTLSSDLYSVSLNEDQDNSPGGTVNLLTAPATGTVLVVVSNVAYEQPIVFTNQGGFYPDLLNEGYDRSTILAQQLNEKLERALIVPVTSEKTPEETMTEILDVADKANEYAQKAEETYQEVLETQEEILETQNQVDAALAEVESDRQEVAENTQSVSEMLQRAEEIDAGVQEVLPVVDDIASIGDHMESVITVADDLQGYPIASMDFGSITDPSEPTTVVDGGNIKAVADNIADVSNVAENVDDVVQAVGKAEEAIASASAAAASASAADASAKAAAASAATAQAGSEAVEEGLQDALTAIDTAAQSQVSNLQSKGTEQITAIGNAGATQVAAIESAGQTYSDLAEAWAQKMDGKVEDDASDAEAGYSSRYYAGLAQDAAESAEGNAALVSQGISTATAKAEEAAASASAAAESAKASATSASNAGSAAQTATTKADEALASATAAKGAETAAAGSATAAAGSASAAATSETNAKDSETSAATSASAASTAEANAKTSETNAKASETNAKSSEIAAASSASSAGSSATAAQSAQTAAETAKGLAESAKTAAEAAKTAAETAKAAAEAARDEAQEISGSIGDPLGKAEAETLYAKIAHVHALSVGGDATGSASLGKETASMTLTLTNSGATSGSYGPTADGSIAFGGTILVPSVTVDAKGRVTSIVSRTLTMPAEITWTSIQGKPSTFTPAEHSHTLDQVTGLGTLASKNAVGAAELADTLDFGGLA